MTGMEINGDTTKSTYAKDDDNSHLDTVIDYDTSNALLSALKRCGGCLNSSTSKFEIDSNIDVDSSHPQDLEEEMARLENLKSYQILDTGREQEFERLTALTARIFSVPIALVSLVDLGRQWFMSNRGLGDVRETHRNVAFCAHAIRSKMDVLIVSDATKDQRFKDSPLVIGPPFIRFYAGSPLTTPEGYKIGTLCIIDTKPRPAGLNLAEKQNLRELAGMVVDNMVCRKTEKQQLAKQRESMIACTSHDLLTPLTCILLNLSLLKDDEHFMSCMDKNHLDLINTSINCANIMDGICHDSIQAFRMESFKNKTSYDNSQTDGGCHDGACLEKNDSLDSSANQPHNLEDSRGPDNGTGPVVMAQLIKNIRHVMETYPKKVPLTLDVSDDVPPVIISNALAIFRSALNILTNACTFTVHGAINFRVFVKCPTDTDQLISEKVETSVQNSKAPLKRSTNRSLVFECTDSGPGVDVENLNDLFRPFGGFKAGISHKGCMGLGLFSVSRHIGGLDGEFGYRPRADGEIDESNGSVFWFSVPIQTPQSSRNIESKEEMKVSINNSSNQEEMQVSINSSSSQAICEREMTLLANQTETLMRTRKVKRKLDRSETQVHDEVMHTYSDEQAKIQKHNPAVFQPVIVDTPMVSNNHKKNKDSDSASSSIISSLGPRKKIALVIDDSKIICKVFQRALTKQGFEVKLAENGMEGLEKMQRNVFDLVFCDFLMPIMDGLDCVQQYREWESKHRSWFKQYIIGISAHSGGNDSDRGLKIGMNVFYSKPLHLKTLIEIVQSDGVTSSSERLDKLAETADAVPYCTFSNRLRASESECSLATLNLKRNVCLIADETKCIYQAMVQCLELRGWGVSVVTNGEDAFRLLKMRNWNVVFINNKLPLLSSVACITKFRKWESENRIARQDNIHLVLANSNSCSKTILPPGFDGVINEPFRPLELYEVIDSASKKLTIL